MPLVTSRAMLLDAQKQGYAVGAFNIENMEMAQAIVEAAEELNAPVILQTTSKLYDPKTLGMKAKECGKELTREKIRMCGADGKAP